MSFDRTVLPVNCYAWKITNMLVGAGQLIEKSRLAAVLVARQRESILHEETSPFLWNAQLKA